MGWVGEIEVASVAGIDPSSFVLFVLRPDGRVGWKNRTGKLDGFARLSMTGRPNRVLAVRRLQDELAMAYLEFSFVSQASAIWSAGDDRCGLIGGF